MDTYKGESPSKKLARLHLWLHVQNILGQKFLTKKHMVIASREAGDVSILLGLGVPAKNIIAVDIDAKAAQIAAEKFPGVKVHHDDVEEIANRYHRELASVNLDFCSPINSVLLDKIGRIINQSMPEKSVITVGFLAGRERDEVVSEVIRSMADNIEIGPMDDAFGVTDIMHETHTQELLQKYKEYSDKGKEYKYTKKEQEADKSHFHSFNARADAIAHEIDKRLYGKPVLLERECMAYYVSRTKSSKGIPMVFLQGIVRRPLPGKSIHKITEKINRTLVIRESFSACSTNGSKFEASEIDIIAITLHISKTDTNAHLLLNVPKGTLIAWRAWKAMGKYPDSNPIELVNHVFDITGTRHFHHFGFEYPPLKYYQPEITKGERVELISTRYVDHGAKMGSEWKVYGRIGRISPDESGLILGDGNIRFPVVDQDVKRVLCAAVCAGCGGGFTCIEKPYHDYEKDTENKYHICDTCSQEGITSDFLSQEIRSFAITRPWETMDNDVDRSIMKSFMEFRKNYRKPL